MKFDDPVRLDCPGCSAPLAMALEDVVLLEAKCPKCGHSFRELGLSMRRYANAQTRYFVVTEVIWIFEGLHGFTTEEAEIHAVQTPADLVELMREKSRGGVQASVVLSELAGRIRRPLDRSHLQTPIEELVPEPMARRI
ncbi:MAG: hypothetical protein AAF799_27205 [Myxococcota bacterium]